ncbi:MAG: type II toxin-antitoxin system VapC family toxin [Acidimicrobiaceae bacterium]|nr:type II toxin-antitoxin system VapC family toxin [Acidimicrobiaceae bacterium]
MYLLDTNVVSEIRKISSGRADRNVVAWAEGVDAAQTYLSVITIGELEHGVLLAERRDPDSGAVLRHWLDNDVCEEFEQQILPVDTAVARRAAALHVPDPAPVADALIAAAALSHDMVLVTRNAADFHRFEELRLVNPWDPQ